jgi:outer membrane protein assembly factor BamB
VLRGIRISDGDQLFEMPSGGYTAASPLIAGGFAFYGTFGNEVIGVNLKARKIAWRYEHPERKFPFYSSPALAAGKVIIGGRDKYVYALDARTGKPAWSFGTRARIDSSPAVSGERVYIGSNDGRFYVLDLGNGSKIWEFQAGSALSASPAIADGRVVIGAQDGRIYCFGS